MRLKIITKMAKSIKEILAAKAAKDAAKPQPLHDGKGLNDNIIFSVALERAGASQDCIDDCIFMYDYSQREKLLKYFQEKQKNEPK